MNETTTPDNHLIVDPYNLVVFSIFALTILIGVLGNGLLILTVALNKSMYNVPNIFLVSLAIGDLAVLLLSVPFRMMLYLYKSWIYGATMCHIFEFTINLSQGVSIFTLTALAGDRFVAIVMPMKTYVWSSKKKALFISVSIWFIAFLFALPDIITSELYEKKGILSCLEYGMFRSNKDLSHHPYVISRRIINLFVYFIIPFLIISFFYISIAINLHSNSSMPVRDNLKIGQSKLLEKQARARKKIAKIILVITVFFIICWFPRYIYIFYVNYSGYTIHFSKVRPLKIATYILSFLNSCINPPFLYMMSADFKRYFNHYLFGCCCKSMRVSKYRRNSSTCATLNTQINRTGVSFEDLALN